MNRKSIAVFTTLAVRLTGSIVTHAEPMLYTPDRWHTRIYFTLSHVGLSNYGGRFIEHDIRFKFDITQRTNNEQKIFF